MQLEDGKRLADTTSIAICVHRDNQDETLSGFQNLSSDANVVNSMTSFANRSINSRGGMDVINTGSGNNTINAGSGDDTIFACKGTDVVSTGSGNDTLEAGIGVDQLFGRTGDDKLWGGEDADTISAAMKAMMDAKLNTAGHQAFTLSNGASTQGGTLWFGAVNSDNVQAVFMNRRWRSCRYADYRSADGR